MGWQWHIQCWYPLDIVATICNMQGKVRRNERIPNHLYIEPQLLVVEGDVMNNFKLSWVAPILQCCPPMRAGIFYPSTLQIYNPLVLQIHRPSSCKQDEIFFFQVRRCQLQICGPPPSIFYATFNYFVTLVAMRSLCGFDIRADSSL